MSTLKQDKQFYEFGPFRLDTGERQLMRQGKPVALPPKVFDTLLLLVENSGHLVEKDILIKAIWPDSFVEDGSLTQNISYLRKALGEHGSKQQYIETIPKRGYRFIEPVTSIWESNGQTLSRRGAEAVTGVNEGPVSSETSASAVQMEQAPPNGQAHGVEALHELARPIQQTLPDHRSDRAGSTIHQPIPRKSLWLTISLIIAFGLATAAWISFRALWSEKLSAIPSSEMCLTKLTQTGQMKMPAISSNGKYVAYVQDDGRAQSLWVRQVENGSSVQLISPAGTRYQGLTFTRDDTYLYYVAYENAGTVGTLSQIPILGGIARKIIEDIDSPVTLSPDGKQLAFVRNFPAQGETSLVIANSDGSAQRKLSTRVRPNPFLLSGPAWSPDGKVIASAVRSASPAGRSDLVAVSVEDGSETVITSQQPGQQWLAIKHVAWLKDGRGILAVAWREGAVTFSDQIWYFSWPGGEPRRITNDSNTYADVSVAADGRTLVASQFTRISSIQVSPSGETDRAEKISSGLVGNATVTQGLCWTPDGKVVYSSDASGRSDLWVMNADGSGKKQLTDDDSTDLKPAITRDGRYIAFASYRRSGMAHIWLMNSDGSNLTWVTAGPDETDPSFSPDGQWIVYSSIKDGTPKLWKTPTHGGPPVQLTSFYSFQPAVSPDGKWVAFFYYDDLPRRLKVGVIPFGSGKSAVVGAPTKVFEDFIRFSSPILRWSADSQAIIYSKLHEGIINLWSQRLDSASPQKLTDFKEDRVFSFDLSRDGKRFAYERGHVLSDLVLISNFDSAH